jgi:hypothetical protein
MERGEMSGQQRRNGLAAALTIGVAGLALAQDAPKPAAPAAPVAPGSAVPPDVVKWVDTQTLGGTIATNHFLDAAATDAGVRTQFDKLPDDVAFEVWREGRARRGGRTGSPMVATLPVPAIRSGTTTNARLRAGRAAGRPLDVPKPHQPS